MSLIIKRPLTQEQKKILAAKQKPSAGEIQNAQDQLFMYLLEKVAELEIEFDGKKNSV